MISFLFRTRRALRLIHSSGLLLAGVAFAGTLPRLGAQTVAPGASPAPATLPLTAVKSPDVSKEAVAIDKLYTRIREEADGTGTRQTTARVRVLADAGVKQLAVLAFTYTASNQQVDIAYVRVIKPDGSIITTPDYNIQDMPADVSREAPMYSDIHQKHVAVRGLGVGDTLEYQITLRTLKADVPGQFWFDYNFEKNVILLDEQLDVDVPADKAVTVVSADVQPTMTTAAGRKLYHWASSNLARPDPDAPAKSTKNQRPSVQVTTFTSWEQVGAWYGSLQKDALTVTPAIQARVAQLTKGLTTDQDKVRAIFNDVALHIHYVALDFGIGRYQPHSADDVLANEYGDCKDKHTLLATMLKAAGIEAWPVLISSNSTLDPAVPSPGQFDHVITVVPEQGKLLWMDSTEEVAPVGVLIATLRDKQALAVPASKAAYLERTPSELPYVQSAGFKVDGKLNDQGTFTAHFIESYHGDAELIFRSLFRSVPQAQWKDFVQNMSNMLGFAGEVKNPVVSAVEQTSQPLQFSFDYTREKFGEWDDHRISPPLPPVGWELAPGVKQKKPGDDIDLGGPGEQVYAATVHMPSGWTLVPPSDTNLVEDWAEYHAKYSYGDGVFTAKRHLVVKKDKVPLADWDKYLAFRRAIYDDESRTEMLSHPGQSMADLRSAAIQYGLTGIREEVLENLMPLHDVVTVLMADPPAAGDGLAHTVTASSQAVNNIEARSTSLAATDPQSLYWATALDAGWCMRGWAALANGDDATAENYLRVAWNLSQDSVSGYLLGRVLEAKGEKLAAAHQYELAHIATGHSPFGGFSPEDEQIRQRISDAYRRVTGHALTASGLNHGMYTGSLQAELDKETEIHQIVHTTRLTGQALYAVAFAEGKPVKAAMLNGEKGFASLVPVLQAHAYRPELPSGSKAVMLREVRVICSPWAGCDAYLVAPGSVEMPSLPMHVVDVAPAPSAAKGTKAIRIEPAPAAARE